MMLVMVMKKMIKTITINLIIISVASVIKNLPSPPTTRVEPSRSFSRAQSEHWWMTKVKWDFKTTWQTQPWPITTLVKYSAQTNLYKVFCVVLLLKLLDRLPQPACSRLLSIIRGGRDDQGWSVVVGHHLEETIHKFLAFLETRFKAAVKKLWPKSSLLVPGFWPS